MAAGDAGACNDPYRHEEVLDGRVRLENSLGVPEGSPAPWLAVCLMRETTPPWSVCCLPS